MAVDPTGFANLPSTVEKLDVTIIETDSLGKKVIRDVRSMVYLKQQATEQMQSSLQQILDATFPNSSPMVTLYAAGRLCRLKSMDGPVLVAGFDGFHGCYKNSYGAGPKPNGAYATAMGACMVDEILKNNFINPITRPSRIAQFRLDPTQFAPFEKFLIDGNFKSTQDAFMKAECWRETCPDKATWYSRSDRMAN